ncbi:xanthine dehydrogenase family protein molybdopterin-binding subunit [Planctomycetota bacterium]
MLYAKILRPPAHGAKLKKVDTTAAEKMDGIQVIKDGDLIAVLHKYPDEAEKALAAIKAEYDVPEAKVDDKTIFEHLQRVGTEKDVEDEGGNIQTGEKLASASFEETYLNSYVAHAPIETHTALAKVESNKATVWASTQTPFSLKGSISEELDLPEENVRVITPFVGGGFGGKSRNQQAIEAARLSKLTQKPIQVAWSREEEFFYDTFRPAAVVKIKSGIKDSGEITLWDYNVYYAGTRGSYHIYNIPHHRTVSTGGGERAHPFGTGAWRAPANNTNTFARESQIEIMASKAGMDPLEFRLKNLTDKKMLRTLKAAAQKFGWRPAKTPSGRGFGVACGIDSGTYVATIAEVEVDTRSGHVQVKRVVCAQDMGLVINPEGARLQMEGCITMGLGYALTEEIHFNGGNIYDRSFHTYKLPTFSWTPKIETVLVESEETDPQGGGEPAIVTIGAVVANAICDATEARLFQLPMTPQRVKEALTISQQAALTS